MKGEISNQQLDPGMTKNTCIDLVVAYFLYAAAYDILESIFPIVFPVKSINLFTSASCVEERVGIAKNGCALGPKSYPSSLTPNLHLAGPGIHGQTGLAQSNKGSDTCVQYALPDRGPEGAGS